MEASLFNGPVASPVTLLTSYYGEEAELDCCAGSWRHWRTGPATGMVGEPASPASLSRGEAGAA